MVDGVWQPELQIAAGTGLVQEEAGEIESSVVVGTRLFTVENSVWQSLSGSATWDGIIVTICLLVTTIAFNFAIARVVYGDLRRGRRGGGGGSSKQEMSYLGMARLLHMEEFTRSRKATHKVSLNGTAAARYDERNRVQNTMARAAGILIMLMEIAIIVVALPSNRGRMLNSAEWTQMTLITVEDGVTIYRSQAGYYCAIGSLIEGINVSSNARWETCFISRVEGGDNPPECSSDPLDEGIYVIQIETKQSQTTIEVFFQQWLLRSDLTSRIRFEGSPAYHIPHAFTAAELDDQYYLMLNNMFIGGEAEFLERTVSPADDKGVERVQYKLQVSSFVQIPSSSPSQSGEPLTLASYFIQAFYALFEFTRSDGLVDLLVYDEESDEFVNLESQLEIYTYVGSFITALGSVIMASSSLLLAAATIALFKSVPDSSWMLKLIFGRNSCDNIGSGPEKVLHLTKSVSDEGKVGHVQYGVPEGSVEVKEFQSGVVIQ